MWKSAIVCILLLAAQNLRAAETFGGCKSVFGGVLLTIAAVVGLIFIVAFIVGCFGEDCQKEPETGKDKSISR